MGPALLTLIGTLAGAVVGGIVSYVTNSRTTARTLRVQTENTLRALDAEHGQRLQDLQAPAYEEAIAALIHRRDKREHDLSPVRWDKRTESVVRSTLDDYQPSNWYESQSRLALYASHSVLDANEVANNAHEKILGLTRELADLREAAVAVDPADPNARVELGRKHKAIFERIQSGLKEAATADSNLMQLMRRSVHARPSQYLPAGPGAEIDVRRS